MIEGKAYHDTAAQAISHPWPLPLDTILNSASHSLASCIFKFWAY